MWEILSPDEVFAFGDDGVVHVTWTDPPAGGSPGVGDECIGFDYYYNEIAGIVDCIGQCVPELTVTSWLGDGLCDDGTWGVYLIVMNLIGITEIVLNILTVVIMNITLIEMRIN